MACWDTPVSESVLGCSASNLQCLLLLPFGQDQRFCWVHLQPVSKQTIELGQHKQTCSQVLNLITCILFENLSRHMTKPKQLLKGWRGKKNLNLDHYNLSALYCAVKVLNTLPCQCKWMAMHFLTAPTPELRSWWAYATLLTLGYFMCMGETKETVSFSLAHR